MVSITPSTPLTEAPQEGFFLPECKVKFEKPAITIQQQIELLKNRGLTINDEDSAAYYLQYIGYYRLSGYFRYFTDPEFPGAEKFYDDANFERVVDLYTFDRRLRTLLLDALERIEVSVKACLSDSASRTNDPFWIYDPQHFDYGSHNEILDSVRDCLNPREEKQKHIFLTHFFRKYADDHPPVWMVMEALSFGPVSKLYKSAKGAVRLPIAQAFSLQHDILESWLHALVFARNVCAHHCRVWNRTYTIKPKIPKRKYNHWPEESRDKLYVICCIIQHIMKETSDGTGWSERLKEVVNGRPNVPLSAMGFPENWETQSPWV